MGGIKIFREGKADERFLSDIIVKFFGEKMTDVEFVDMNGYTDFRNNAPNFQANTFSGGVNLLILDADYPEEGGFEKRSQYVESQRAKYDIEFKLFLFPNNKDDGNLETLLSRVINPKNQGIIECWDKYIDCLSLHAKAEGRSINIPDQKNKFYTYIYLLDGSDNAKEPTRDYLNADHWYLESEALTPLLEFLRPHF